MKTKTLLATLGVAACAAIVCADLARAQFAPNTLLRAQDLNAALAHPTITGGSIDGAPIGATEPSTGAFTTVTASVLATSGTVTFALSSPPSTSATACVSGQQAWDTGYVYVCVNTNTWKRAALSSW